MTDGYAVVHLRLTKGTAPGSFPEPPRSGDRLCSGGRHDVVVDAEHVGRIVRLLDACEALVAFRAVDRDGVSRFLRGEVVHQPPIALPGLHAVEQRSDRLLEPLLL